MSVTKKVDFDGLVERLCTEGGVPKDPLEWRPSPDCLSIKDVVNMFQFGATAQDVYHLSKCDRCLRWVDNYAKSTSTKPLAETIMNRSLWRSFADLFGAGRPNEPLPVPALLYVLGDGIQVRNLEDPLSLEIALLGGPSGKVQVVGSDLSEIEVKSLKLDGALIAEGASLRIREVEQNMTCVVVRFDNARLTTSPQKDIKDHLRSFHNICLSGRYAGGPSPAFSGKADIELVRTAGR
jgi:hypothetical protein